MLFYEFLLFIMMLRCLKQTFYSVAALLAYMKAERSLLILIFESVLLWLVITSTIGLFKMRWSGVVRFFWIHGLSLAFCILLLVLAFRNGVSDSSLIIEIESGILPVLWIIPEWIYFRKRRLLFSPVPDDWEIADGVYHKETEELVINPNLPLEQQDIIKKEWARREERIKEGTQIIIGEMANDNLGNNPHTLNPELIVQDVDSIKRGSAIDTTESQINGAYCRKCGAPLVGNGAFCTRCGTPTERTGKHICRFCGQSIPLDSKFCQFCGGLLEAEKVEDKDGLTGANENDTTQGEKNNSNVIFMPFTQKTETKEPAAEQQNHEVPVTEEEQNIQASPVVQTNKAPIRNPAKRINKKVAALVSIIVALFLLNCFQAFLQWKSASSFKEETDQLQKQLEESQEEVAVLSRSYQFASERIQSEERLLNERRERIEELNTKLDFYDAHIVFVPNDKTNLYHVYGCKDLDLSYFWAYNEELAVQYGYEPCSKCVTHGHMTMTQFLQRQKDEMIP